MSLPVYESLADGQVSLKYMSTIILAMAFYIFLGFYIWSYIDVTKRLNTHYASFEAEYGYAHSDRLTMNFALHKKPIDERTGLEQYIWETQVERNDRKKMFPLLSVFTFLVSVVSIAVLAQPLRNLCQVLFKMKP